MNPILCPVRNNLALNREAVRTFLAQDIGNVEVLIIDNDSQDGTAQWLWSQPVQTVTFRPGKSVAASWNFGLRHFFGNLRAEYVLVVNNDVELRPDTYRHLVNDGGLFVTAVGTRDRAKIAPITLAQVPGTLHSIHQPPDPARKRHHPDFSTYLIRRECWERVGPFDECFVGGYCEDASYDARMYRAGIKAYCLDLPFLHYGAQTLANADQVEAAAIRYNADKNRKLFKEMYGVEVGSAGYYSLFGDWKNGPPSAEVAEVPQAASPRDS